jgi:dihydrofolate reductase
MMQQPKVAAVVAMDESRVIGLRGTLPWHVPEDLAHFRRLTDG